MKTFNVYNLVFPDYVKELKIGPYTFRRVDRYKEALQGLYHRLSISYEYSVTTQTGTHQVTAIVECPDEEPEPILPWNNDDATLLLDILLLLTIFTRRQVFLEDWKVEDDVCIRRDPRIATWGSQLEFSVNTDRKRIDIYNGKIVSDREYASSGKSAMEFREADFGLETDINSVLSLISDPEWQEEYDNGFFLFLYRGAIFQPFIESAFSSCWTIWEHLFAVKNRKWLDKETIKNLPVKDKLAFILNTYFDKVIDEEAKNGIIKICQCRNRIIHYGKNHDKCTNEDLKFLIDLTEQLMSVILGLKESYMFKTLYYRWEDPKKK